MANGPRFDFFEKVVVDSANPALLQINNELGAVLGRACDEDGQWFYAVRIYARVDCWYCREEDLRPTGEFDRRETFFDGASIQVSLSGELQGFKPPIVEVDDEDGCRDDNL
jgi:hypothetical protein